MNQETPEESIRLCDLSKHELQGSLNFLFGGVGDARHVWATLLDTHCQLRSLDKDKEKKKNDLCLRITMNDINAQVLVKDIFVFVLTYRIAVMEDVESLMHNKKTYMLGWSFTILH